MKEKVNIEISEWVEKYTESLYSWAFHKVSNEVLAEDLVQDTFLAATEKLENFKQESSPKTWLFSILNNKIVDHYRKKINQPYSTENQILSTLFDTTGGWSETGKPKDWEDSQEEHLLDNPAFRNVLTKCLDSLPEKWSTSVKLKYLTEKKGEEICQELGVTPSNFWQIIHRAKLQLRDCIEVNWFKS